MVLGLDLGATTGWALGDYIDNKITIIDSGHTNVYDKRIAAMRFVNFNHLLNNINTESTEKITQIYYEFVYMHHKSVDASYAYGGYKACLEVWAEKQHIPLQGVLCTSARKRILGSGSLSKSEAFDKIKLLHPRVVDHNEADAVLVLHYGIVTRLEQLEYAKKIEREKRKEKQDGDY